MDVVAEVIKLVGGIFGIATAGFIVIDRVWRNRPIFALHAKPRVPGDNYLFLRVKNVLDEDVVIENWSISPGLVGLSTDTSVRALAGAMLHDVPATILPPLEELKFHLMILDRADPHKENNNFGPVGHNAPPLAAQQAHKDQDDGRSIGRIEGRASAHRVSARVSRRKVTPQPATSSHEWSPRIRGSGGDVTGTDGGE